MVKSRFPGKPSKCFGRRSVSGVNSVEADELKAAEDCYLRLTLFNYLFKTDDEDKSFHGFSPHDENKKSNKSTFDKSKKRKIKASTSDKKTEPFDKCNKPDVSDTNETSNKPDIELEQPETSTASDKSESKTANIQSNTTFSGKFVLPSRSNHSSRVIKPNKRFLEGETSPLPSKKVHLNSSVKPSAVQCVPSSSEVVEPERSSTPVQQPSKGRPPKRKSELCGGLAKKFVLRKPRLKIKTLPLPSVGGPFSSSAGNSLSLQGANQSPGAIKVFCGVCGALRTFKFLHHARKFGIFSCLPCRKFILKIIRSERKNALSSLECVSGNGNCSIRQNSLASQCFVNDVTKEKPPVESDRCEACWLNLCLQSFHMPHKLVKRLTTFLPEKLQKSMKLSKSVAISKNDVISDTTENSGNEIKFIKRNRVSKETINSRRGLSSHNLRGQSSSGDTSKKGRSRLNKFPAAGPRVKHVCRSASLVLRQPVATFDNQPLDTDDAAPLIQENDILEEAASTAPENQEEEITPLPTTDIIVKNTQENEPPPVINRINFPPVARMLQDLGRANNELLDGMENHEQAKLNARVSIDFWESYDPDEVSRMGFPLIGFQPLRLRAVCFLCGSAGLEKLIHCGNCCEPYHPFCVSSKLPAEPSGDWWRLDWLCPKCTVCVACSRTGGTQLSCCKCSRNYHSACITSARFNIYDSNWVCPSCLFCKSCNGSSVYVFIGNMPLCKSCFKLRKKGSFCPLCQCCYDDNDYSTKMMECAVCKCWIHAQCEGLSNEKYQVLSYLPSTIEFICRLCCKNPPPPWSHAVEAELKAGYLNVIKILSKNKTACQAFKSSPKKQRVCVCSSNQTSPIHLNDLMNNSVSEVLSIDSPPDTSIDQEIKSSDLGLLTPKLTKDDEESLKIVKSDFLNLVSDKNDCKFSEELPKVNDSVPSSENTQLLKIAYEERAEKFEKPNLIDNTVTAKEKTEQSSVRLCSCQKPDPAAPQSLSLLSIKNKATLDEYHSVLEFHNDMVLVTKEIGNEELIETYNRCLKQIFPWFEPGLDDTVLGSPMANTSPVGANQIVENPKDETEEAKRKWSGLESLLNLDQASYYIGMDFQETRFCVLCKCVGEGIPRREGRLLYCGRNEWVHTNCALWSSEVFEEIDGSLQNVHSAVSRARLIRCQHCGKKGASLGCCAKSCPLAFHFGCALSAECVFLENKELYCKSHASYQGTREKQKEEDFFVKRSVYVELDNKKSKDVFRSLVKVYIGSLEVSHLGEVLPDLSDHPDVIVPCEYWCSRLFWSCKEPWKIVRYTIKTKVTNLTDEFDVCNDMNYTVDHSLEFTPPPSPADSLMGGKYSPDAGERDIKAMINQIIETICTKEDESDHQSTDLLPPELSDVIFDDLPKDFLDRVTVHDIFTKMNFDDYLFSETKEDKQENNYISSNAEPVGNKARVVNVKPTLRHEKVSKSIGAAKQKGYEKIKECRVTLDREPVNRWKRKQSLLQLDGAADYSESDQSNDASDVDMSHTTENSDFTEDKPVKCARCHRTYRTRQSYERHLETCSSDVLSCSESDLSEEEKSEGFPDGELKSSDSSESQVFVPVSMEVNSSVSNENNIQTIIENQSNKSVVCINGMNFEQNCEERMSISPVGTSLNNESLTDSSFQAGQTVVTPPVETLIQDKVVNLQHPTIILQSMPTENIMSSIIQPSFHQETAQPSIQYIINDQEKNHFLHNSNGATTYHIQPQMSQPLVQNLPAVVATVVQANGVEQLVLNNSGPNIEMYGQQQSGMFFANQPMIVGMETVVSNTVMQSSRFIGGTPGVLASSYSATTTQVFQAAKPVIEIPQSYVFVNSNPLMISSNDAQRILSNGPAPTQNPSWNGFKINTLDSTKFEKVSTHQSLPLSIEKKEAPNGFASFNQIGAVPTVSEHLNGSLQLKEIGNFNKHHSVHHSNFVNKMPSSIKAVELPLSSAIHKEKPQQAVAPVVIKRVVEPLKYNKLNCETKVEEKKIDLTEKFSPTLHKKVNPPAIPFKETNSGALMELKDSPSNKVEEKEIISNEVDSKPISCNILPPKILKDHKKIEPKINGHESFKKKNHFIEEPKIAFEISSEDGFHFNTTSLEEAWTKVYETVQSARQAKNLPPLNENPFATPDIMLKKLMGLGNNCMKYLVEQLPGISTCSKYKPTYHNKEPSALERELFCGKRINPSGCARTEQYEHQRKRYDMFSWLASRHRRPPKLLPPEAETSNGNSRRATSINLPMAMRFRHLKDTSKTSVGVFRSDIHGRGLFCLRDIDAGEMVIEYAGEVIRSALTDKRERYYTEKGIGCYMFRIDDKFVVDATMKGNAARFINHSCEPNCYSRVLDILGKKHILIFALRKIHQGEELTYDYKFPLEEDKINCHCLSRKCRKYLN